MTDESTLPDKIEHSQLSLKKEEALFLVLTGHNDSQIASKIGCNRLTVLAWRNHDPVFRECLATIRQDSFRRLKDKWTSAAEVALDVLMDELKSEDPGRRLRSAETLLRWHRC